MYNKCIKCPGGSMSQVVAIPNNSYQPITNTAWVRSRLCKLQKAARDKACQLLAHGRWFCPGTPASPTTKTGRHDIIEILLKVALNTINKSIKQMYKMQLNKLVSRDYSELRQLAFLRRGLLCDNLLHDQIPTRACTHVFNNKNQHRNEFYMGWRQVFTTSSSLYKYINNINQMTQNIHINFN